MLAIYLLRHAETDYNAHAQLIGGRSNHLSLSTKGEKQALEIGRVLNDSGIRFDNVFCSIANRTRQTLDFRKIYGG
jgi:broad specificity phosphatase PhoE